MAAGKAARPRAQDRVGLGLRVKTGRAITVAVVADGDGIRVLDRRELLLHDPATPESRFPYHAGLELPEAKGKQVTARLCALVMRSSAASVAAWIDELRAGGHAPRAAGLVVSSVTDPMTIHNLHMRAHSSEGRLFLEAAAAGLDACKVAHRTLVEKRAYDDAAEAIGRTQGAVTAAVGELGRAVGSPWRAEEKLAAAAAWAALVRE